MGKICIFTDSIGDEFEIRLIVKVSKRKNTRHFETNDGKWYSQDELSCNNEYNIDAIKEGDIIATSNKGIVYTLFLDKFNEVCRMSDAEPYDASKYTNDKPLPKGL